jgi:hypothetical protein
MDLLPHNSALNAAQGHILRLIVPLHQMPFAQPVLAAVQESMYLQYVPHAQTLYAAWQCIRTRHL